MSSVRGPWSRLPVWAISVATAVVTALLTTSATTALTSEPDIDRDAALEFYHRHYEAVFKAEHQDSVWRNNYTESYRRYGFRSKERFVKRYNKELRKVAVVDVFAADGGTNQFLLTNRITYGDQSVKQRTYIVYLVCTDPLARLPVLECPVEHVQINAVQAAETASSS
jgi:hypothetical protein